MARHLMSCRKHALSGGKVAGQLAVPAAPASASGAGRVVRSASTPNPKPYARQSTLYIYI